MGDRPPTPTRLPATTVWGSTCLTLFKRGYHGTFHQLSEAHLHRYVAEFAGRHNMRPLGTVEQMGLVAEGMVGKRLRYADLVATPDSVGASIPVGDPF